MAVKDLFIKIGIKGDKKAQGALKKTEGGMKSLGLAAIKVGGAFFAAQGIIRGFSSIIRLAGEQQKAEAKLNAVLKSTAGVAGLTANELKNMASELQGVTTFGDETIIGAQSLLLTFTKIGEEVFPQATETILNMAVAMETDLKSATVQLGKALNDPITGISALSRVGVQLTDTQKEQIKSFTELGDIASAQKVILGELETQFGGLAKATAQTMAGSLDQMTNSVGDAGEAIGILLSPAVVSIANKFRDAATGVAAYITELQNSSKTLEGVVNMDEREIILKAKIAVQRKTLEKLAKAGSLDRKTELDIRMALFNNENELLELEKQRIEIAESKTKIVEEAAIERAQRLLPITKEALEIKRSEISILPELDIGYSNFITTKQVQIEQQETEAKNLARLIQQYPELAEKLGLIKTKTDEVGSSWDTFNANLDTAAAASVSTASSVSSTTDALRASEDAARQSAITFVSGEVQKAVAGYIRKFLMTTPLPPIISAPLAIAGGAAFGSLMSSAIARNFAQGGIVPGKGSQDTVPAMLTPGEVILNKAQQENLAGGMGGITLNISAPLVDETIIDTIIPAIQKAQRMNLA